MTGYELLLFLAVTIGALALLAAGGILMACAWAGCLILFQGGKDLSRRTRPYFRRSACGSSALLLADSLYVWR